MPKRRKILAVRIDEDLRDKVKWLAYKNKMTMEIWIRQMIEDKIKKMKKERKMLCQPCGGWELTGTQCALLKNCENCGKEAACFFCEAE